MDDLQQGRGAWILKEMAALNARRNVNEEIPLSSAMDGLVSVLHFPKHLTNFRLSNKDAFHICRWKKESECTERADMMFNMVRNYVKDAINIAENNVFIKTHSLFEQKISIMVRKDTIIRYVQEVVRLFYFIYNFTGGIIHDDEEVVGRSSSASKLLGADQV